MAKRDTWTITVEMTVFAGNMDKESVKSIAQTALPLMLEGSDYMSVEVINAKRDN